MLGSTHHLIEALITLCKFIYKAGKSLCVKNSIKPAEGEAMQDEIKLEGGSNSLKLKKVEFN